MNPVPPGGGNAKWREVVIAKDQPEYLALPALVNAQGVVLTEWELTAEELHLMMCGGRLRLWVYTFGHPLQPVMLDVVPPECGVRE